MEINDWVVNTLARIAEEESECTIVSELLWGDIWVEKEIAVEEFNMAAESIQDIQQGRQLRLSLEKEKVAYLKNKCEDLTCPRCRPAAVDYSQQKVY